MKAENDIIEREKGFWTGSAEYYERWLARDVLMVFPAPAGILKREGVLIGIRSGTRWESIEMTDIAMHEVGGSVIALAYRARARKPGSNSAYTALIGSIYVREDGEWKLGFHQHTPIDEPQRARA